MTTTKPQHGLALISLIIPNYDSAITYFTSTLNFTLTSDSPSTSTATGAPKRWVVVHPPSSTFPNTATTASSSCGILLAQADTDAQEALIGKQWGGRVGLFLHVEDFEAQYAFMKGRGVEFVGEPRVEAYGRVVVWRDAWGNLWDLLGPV